MLDDMLALANSVCLLALSRSDRHVLALLLCAGLIARCCAVFAVDARQHARIYILSMYIPGIKKAHRTEENVKLTVDASTYRH